MITVVVGKEIEKLKGEFESVINGMNMVGEIPYNVYSELFDVGADCIQKAYELGRTELKKENAELKELLKELFSELNDLSELSGMSYKAKLKEQVEQFLNSEVEK